MWLASSSFVSHLVSYMLQADLLALLTGAPTIAPPRHSAQSGPQQDWYKLGALPARYFLYVNVERKPDPEPDRRDPYLWGPPKTHPTARHPYRSAPEVAPHVWWLLVSGGGPEEQRTVNGRVYGACPCGVCSSGVKKQKLINAELGVEDCYNFGWGKRSGGGSGGRGGKKGKGKGKARLEDGSDVEMDDDDDDEVELAIPRSPKGRAKRLNSPGATYLGPFASERQDRDLGTTASPFRKDELAWVQLDTPLVHPSGDSTFDITHWPGVILACALKSRGGNLDGTLPPLQEAPQFDTPSCRQVYQLQLLGLEDIVLLEEESLRPWLGRGPPALNLADCEAEATFGLVFDGKVVVTPKLANFGQDGRLAMAAFALAVQTAATIAAKYAPVDPYVLAGAVPLVGVGGEGSAQVAAQPPSGVGFQSVWWGAEEVHSEELVRLVGWPEQVDAAVAESIPADVRRHGCLLKLAALFSPSAPEGVVDGEGAGECAAESAVASWTIKMAGVLIGLAHDSAPIGSTGLGPSQEQDEGGIGALRLPLPPAGYRWRRLTPEGSQVALELGFLAGRYYRPSEHLDCSSGNLVRVLKAHAQARAAAAADEAELTEEHLALVLGGLLPSLPSSEPVSSWLEVALDDKCFPDSRSSNCRRNSGRKIAFA